MTLLTLPQYEALYAHLERCLCHSSCSHTLRHTRAYLRKLYAAYAYQPRAEHVRANIEKLIEMGGLCDCEVLMNVSPAEWETRRDDVVSLADIVGAEVADRLVSRLIQHAFRWEEGGEA